ncbi:DUF6461 domain-containing protein [Streptomyces sp. 8N114]|uniref:DUF6461 domain-containing protein n=1 Tax=Streptomyces sp. 8N114 TaxID=3457419 RepID=UPI003FD1D908
MSASSVTAADFTWLAERYPTLSEGHCLTYVRGLDPDEALRRMGVTEAMRTLSGVAEVCKAAEEAWDEYDDDKLFVAAVEAEGAGEDGTAAPWTLLVEPNGFLGNDSSRQEALSRQSALVSHYYNIGAGDHFHWVEDGRLRLHFEPLFPAQREGSDAEQVAGVLRESGFDLREGEERDFRLCTEAAFALAARLTGVLLTPQLLDSLRYTGGLVPYR